MYSDQVHHPFRFNIMPNVVINISVLGWFFFLYFKGEETSRKSRALSERNSFSAEAKQVKLIYIKISSRNRFNKPNIPFYCCEFCAQYMQSRKERKKKLCFIVGKRGEENENDI